MFQCQTCEKSVKSELSGRAVRASCHTTSKVNRIGLSVAVAGGILLFLGGCGGVAVTSENNSSSKIASTDQEWYSGGNLAAASMSEWIDASDRDRLATSADLATQALEMKYGSLQATLQKLGTMENLRPYAIEVQACITSAGKQPTEMTRAHWRKVMEKQRVREVGAACVVLLSVNETAASTSAPTPSIEANTPSEANRTARPAIGKWLDTAWPGGQVVTIYREGGKLYIQGSSKEEAVERTSPLGRRFQTKERNDFGEYEIIDGHGDLQLWDRQGFIRTAKKIE